MGRSVALPFIQPCNVLTCSTRGRSDSTQRGLTTNWAPPRIMQLHSGWDKPSEMEVITLQGSDAALESLLTEFSLLRILHTPLTLETDWETLVLVRDDCFSVLLLLMPDDCAVASHACFITVQHFCSAQDSKGWTFDTATHPFSGHLRFKRLDM